jgi:hypothetical protein
MHCNNWLPIDWLVISQLVYVIRMNW